MTLFSATPIALLQNLSFQTVYLFPPKLSLFPCCHLIYIGLDLILGFSSLQFHEFRKKVRKLLFSYLFQKLFHTLGWDGGLGGRLRRKGVYVFIQLIHVMQQKPTQHCKATTLQLKIKF